MTDYLKLAEECGALISNGGVIVNMNASDLARPIARVLAEAVPQGWKLVPVEPTPEMMAAAKDADMDHSEIDEWLEFEGDDVKRTYRAMLAAAPALPEEPQ